MRGRRCSPLFLDIKCLINSFLCQRCGAGVNLVYCVAGTTREGWSALWAEVRTSLCYTGKLVASPCEENMSGEANLRASLLRSELHRQFAVKAPAYEYVDARFWSSSVACRNTAKGSGLQRIPCTGRPMSQSSDGDDNDVAAHSRANLPQKVFDNVFSWPPFSQTTY